MTRDWAQLQQLHSLCWHVCVWPLATGPFEARYTTPPSCASTVVGAGILALPAVMRMLGWLPGLMVIGMVHLVLH